MSLKKMISGRQFWSILAVLFILLGVVMIAGHPREEAASAPLPAPEDDVKVLVLNYHMVNRMFISLAIEPEDFDWQMKYLVEHGYHTISPDELYDFLAGTGRLPDRPVLITFDDGYVDNYTTAYPILKKYNLKATIFVVTGFLGKRKGYLTWDQMREMEKNGITRRCRSCPMSVSARNLWSPNGRQKKSSGIRLSLLPTQRACMICTLRILRKRLAIRAALRSSTVMSIGPATCMRSSACRSSARGRQTKILSIVCTIHRI